MGETPSTKALEGLEWLPLARPMMFRRPGFLQPSAWLEHLPFAMWVVDAHRPATLVELGTHHGPSYFGFCQAVAELGLGTSCYAVDTWQGDEHAGFYGQEVYEKVRSYNDANYSGFSRLVRSTFDEAATHFSDGTIDLLHIDGLHTLEAVTHDFESWKPKLSKRAVVLFHDINVRERGFGVFKLFEQLREQYPAFWFVHGHGLGVLGVGPEQGEPLRELYALSGGDGRTLTSVREIFARLGRACADAFERGDVRSKLLDVQARLRSSDATLEQTRRRMSQLERDAGLVEIHRERVRDVVAIAADERGRVLERLSSRDEDLKVARSRLEALERELLEARDRHARDQEGLREAHSRVQALTASDAEHAEQARRLETEVDRLRGEIDRLQGEIDRLSLQVEQHQGESSKLRGEVERHQGESSKLRGEVERHRGESSKLRGEVERHQGEVARLQGEARQRRGEVDARFEEIALLTRRLFETEHARTKAEAGLKRREARLERLERGSGVRWLNRLRRLLRRKPLDFRRDPRDEDVEVIQAAGALDVEWYLATYPDVAVAGVDPVVHYVMFGAEEGRDPSAAFSTRGYLERHPDVRDGGMNPLAHYVLHGRHEGRSAEALS